MESKWENRQFGPWHMPTWKDHRNKKHGVLLTFLRGVCWFHEKITMNVSSVSKRPGCLSVCAKCV